MCGFWFIWSHLSMLNSICLMLFQIFLPFFGVLLYGPLLTLTIDAALWFGVRVQNTSLKELARCDHLNYYCIYVFFLIPLFCPIHPIKHISLHTHTITLCECVCVKRWKVWLGYCLSRNMNLRMKMLFRLSKKCSLLCKRLKIIYGKWSGSKPGKLGLCSRGNYISWNVWLESVSCVPIICFVPLF